MTIEIPAATPRKPRARKQPPLDENYIGVAERISEFREKHPDGSLTRVSLKYRHIGDRDYVEYTAAAYRTPDDPRPGVGTAWEPIPGTTQFTRDSEVQNAETAAWGRAIVAALAADTTKGISSKDELRNRDASVAEQSEHLVGADGMRAVGEPEGHVEASTGDAAELVGVVVGDGHDVAVDVDIHTSTVGTLSVAGTRHAQCNEVTA